MQLPPKFHAMFVGPTQSGPNAQYAKTLCVVKRGRDGDYCIPNEYIAACIGSFLRLPIPPPALCHDPEGADTVWYVSLQFTAKGESMPPIIPAQCVAEVPKVTTGLILFDVLIANHDRRPQNLFLDTSGPSVQMKIFDHDDAVFGFQEGKGLQKLDQRKDAFIQNHCLIPEINTDAHFASWIDRIAQIPDFYIEDVCREVVGYGLRDDEAKAAAEFLKSRRDSIENLISDHQEEFTSINQWSFL